MFKYSPFLKLRFSHPLVGFYEVLQHNFIPLTFKNYIDIFSRIKAKILSLSMNDVPPRHQIDISTIFYF